MAHDLPVDGGDAAELGPDPLPDDPDLSLTLQARPENVAVVRHAIAGLGDVLDIDDQTLSDIKLAVSEACTNAVVHAYPDGVGDDPLEVLAYVRGRRLLLVVRDEGRGIVPRTDSPGLGLGLPLIATLAESVELGTDDRQRTEVRMTFRLDAEPEATA
ncbi:MAG TPA: ATP-binding protein [Solirubrobacteraceae bacterium]|jgi:anti-sigma regulatory factor (Ser/Thr protein kinase)|nr:ATP-binding protein [Solirubrobacteraceae bacterium]